MHQVIIVGAGPAGAYLAYLLAREGINVLLLEKERLPRHKPCGGGISPKVINLLDFDLKSVIEDTIHTVIFTHRLARPITFTGSRPIMYMVSRERFDALLLDRAKEAGVEAVDGIRVKGIQMTENGVSVYADGMEWRGQILIGADGAFSIVARALGLARNKKIAVTLESQLAVPLEKLGPIRGTAKIDYGLVPGGYAWWFPKAGHLSLGVGSFSPKIKDLRLRSYLEEILQVEDLTGLLSTPQIRGWTIPTNCEHEDLHGGRALVIGDAAGLADAFTGEGIYAALFSARLAAEVITEQINKPSPDLQRYTVLVYEKMWPELTQALRISRWFYPNSNLFYGILYRQQRLVNDLIQVLAGDMTYSQVLGRISKVPFMNRIRGLSSLRYT